MSVQHSVFLAFNRGLVSKLGLARSDVKRLALSAEDMINWAPRVLGSMMLRPGLGYTGATASNNAARQLPFVFSITDKASIELTANLMRVWVDDELIVRDAVSSAVSNGTFVANLTGWTDNDESGASSVWVTGGYMGLTGTGVNAAIRDQTVTVAGPDQGVQHALRVTVQRGPVILRVGTSTSDDSYINETELATGTHSIAFTPMGNFNIRFLSRLKRQVLVDAVSIEGSGAMTLPTPWGASDLGNIRFDQSGDVVFAACSGGIAQYRIERRATESWSVVQYLANDGPFRNENVGPITFAAGAISGNTTITASAAYFKSTHAPSTYNPGALFRMTSEGQQVSVSITAENTFSNSIRVTGVGTVRSFSINITGTWSADVTLQRSFDEGVSWIDVASPYAVANIATTYDDGLDNQIVLYRIGVKTGDYVSGTVEITMAITTGSITGVARVTAVTSSLVVQAEIITDLGGTAATDVWAEGAWSDRRGWPSAGGFDEGRLWWFGKDGSWGSISDAFDSFDPDFEGDAGPIFRTIGSGPVDTINWMLPLNRMILGGQGAEFSCRSSTLDEPLTPTNFNIRAASTQGSAPVNPIKIDSRGFYVQRGGIRVFELAIDGETVDYGSTQISAIVPTIGRPGIVRAAAQRQPDTRMHYVRSDGTVAMVVFDKVENVVCWCEIETDGEIEDVMVLPGDPGEEEDKVYYIVKRTIDGNTVRYRERWAFEEDCLGDATLCHLADAHVTFTNPAPSTTVTGLDHLVGEDVVVWADGICLADAAGDIETFTVSAAGEIALTHEGNAYSATTGVVGLPYSAQWKSGKLLQLQAMLGTPLNQDKQIRSVGLVLADVHAKGLQMGDGFDHLLPMPEIEQGATVDPDAVREAYDEPMIPVLGSWNTDSRLCLEAEAPRPVTVLAAVVTVEMHE